MGFARDEVRTERKNAMLSEQIIGIPYPSALSEAITTYRKKEPLERRKKLEELELIYRLDGLTFGIINKYVRDTVGVDYVIRAEDETSRKTIEEFCRRRESNFNRMLPVIVRDNLIFGFSILETVFSKDRSELLRLIRVNPTTVTDYIRDTSNKVKRDRWGIPVGFVQHIEGEKRELPRENIAFFTFTSIEEGEFGIAPLEVLYNPIKYKLNIEKATGEAMWRTGFPPIIVTLGSEGKIAGTSIIPTEEHYAKAKEAIKGFSSKSAIIKPWWMQIERMELGRPERVDTYLNYFNNVIREAFGMPRIETEEKGREFALIDYERAIQAIQLELARQIETEIFDKIVKIKGLKELPRIRFIEYTPTTKLSRARRYGIYSRAGILTYDQDLEKHIRETEGIPVWKERLSPEEEDKRREYARRQRTIRR